MPFNFKFVNLMLILLVAIVFWGSVHAIINELAGEVFGILFMAVVGIPSGYGIRVLEERYPIFSEKFLSASQVVKCVLIAPAEAYKQAFGR